MGGPEAPTYVLDHTARAVLFDEENKYQRTAGVDRWQTVMLNIEIMPSLAPSDIFLFQFAVADFLQEVPVEARLWAGAISCRTVYLMSASIGM